VGKRLKLLAIAFPFGALLAPATPAEACFFVAPACIGDAAECNPTRATREDRERQASRRETWRRLREAETRLAAGGVDAAAEIAELIVPNVRPQWVPMSDCGPMGEIDVAGYESSTARFAALVAGTELEGADPANFPAARREAEIPSLGPGCNSEVRARFASHLRRAMGREEIDQAWLYLKPRQREANAYGGIYARMTRFERPSRQPPLHWIPANRWLREQINGALTGRDWGRSLAAAMADFWAAEAPNLGDDQRTCPLALATYREARAAAVAEMVAQQRARLTAREEARRRQAEARR
jgi:hypothetical protein